MKANKYEVLSDIVSINKDGTDMEFLINGQWTFSLPHSLEYEINGEMKDVLDIDVYELVLRDPDSKYPVPFCAAVNEYHPFLPEYVTAIDCKYDKRFAQNNSGNLHKIMADTPELYVDFIAVNTWPIGIDMKIRIRGENITPFDIYKMVDVQNRENISYIYSIFKKIAQSIRISEDFLAKSKSSPQKAANNQETPVSDPNCIMDGTVLLKYIGPETDVVLPEGITVLSDMLFSGRHDLRSVIIPEGVTEIGEQAFADCTSLSGIHVPDSVQTIGEWAFSDCTNLREIRIPDGVQTIGSYAFDGCTSLLKIHVPDSVTQIGNGAFSECASLSGIHVPNSLHTIGSETFSNCTSLSGIHVPDSVQTIGEWAFSDCTNLREIRIPDGVQILGSHAFDGCISLSNIHIPDSVQTIGDAAFYRCESLVDENGYLIIRNRLHYFCSDSIYAMIPNEVIGIDAWAFCEHTNLSEVHIPGSVQIIGDSAFCNCINLSKIHIPDSVQKIGDSVFYGCESLVDENGYLIIRNRLHYFYSDSVSVMIPNEIIKIDAWAFCGRTNLSEVHIPDSVQAIGDAAFSDCTNLSEIHIPDSVTQIGKWAFDSCENLKIYCSPNSYAQTYAKKHCIPYTSKSTAPEPADDKLNLLH